MIEICQRLYHHMCNEVAIDQLYLVAVAVLQMCFILTLDLKYFCISVMIFVKTDILI